MYVGEVKVNGITQWFLNHFGELQNGLTPEFDTLKINESTMTYNSSSASPPSECYSSGCTNDTVSIMCNYDNNTFVMLVYSKKVASDPIELGQYIGKDLCMIQFLTGLSELPLTIELTKNKETA